MPTHPCLSQVVHSAARLRPAGTCLHVPPLFRIAGIQTLAGHFLGGRGPHVIIPAFSPAAVLAAIADHHVTDVVQALVVLRTGVTATGAELIRHCRERIAAYKCPAGIDFADALPVSAAGQVLKTQLRAAYARGPGGN